MSHHIKQTHIVECISLELKAIDPIESYILLLQAPRTQPSPFPGSDREGMSRARSDPNLTAPVSRSNFDVLPLTDGSNDFSPRGLG